MKKSRKIELLDHIQEWLDIHAETFNAMIEEWEKYNVISKVDNPVQAFECNHCGKCCQYSVDVFPSDMQCWLDEERYDILCSIFPFIDENDNLMYGLPQQRDFFDKIDAIMHSRRFSKQEKNAYNKVKNIVKAVNPGFSSTNDYCIYYNPNVEKHCMIYETRPFACQVYPYELSMFTEIEIPDEISDKYGKTEGAKQLQDEDPMCPNECFSNFEKNLPTECDDDDIYAVLIDRINYLSSTLVYKEIGIDIISLMLEVFAADLRKPKPHTKARAEQKSKKRNKDSDDSDAYRMTFND